jgi:glycosyltransferase involved in cell wall biosynthesis
MKILFQYLSGGGGALSNIILLLQALSKQYPKDHIDIVCSPSSDLHSLGELQNVAILDYGKTRHQEVDRAFLGFGNLGKIAQERRADVIWSLNIGSYVRSSIPQVLSVNNPHQVYPWHITRYHPDNRFHVAALRWFFRRSLRVSEGVIVQTPIMGEYVRKISGAPNRIQVVPKAVENDGDFLPQPLPFDLKKNLETNLGKQMFTFLFVSTYVPHKNHKILVESFERLAAEEIPVRVVITLRLDELLAIGGEKARRLVDSRHLVPVGWVKKVYLKSLYDACDACLMPSLLESLSSVHLEAMQWGKPQISADLPYARDLCGHATLYASAENPVDWVVKVKEFTSDATLRMNLVNAGHEQMKRFPATWAEVALKVRTFLEEIVTGWAKPKSGRVIRLSTISRRTERGVGFAGRGYRRERRGHVADPDLRRLSLRSGQDEHRGG